MTVNELDDKLIYIKDHNLTSISEREAINLACNILESIPGETDVYDFIQMLRGSEKINM